MSVLAETRNRGHTLKMFEVLATHYSEIKTPIDYFGESKYHEDMVTISKSQIGKTKEIENGKCLLNDFVCNSSFSLLRFL